MVYERTVLILSKALLLIKVLLLTLTLANDLSCDSFDKS